MFVRDWMSAPAIVIPGDVRLEAALDLMEKRKIRRFPIVKEGRIQGIVTKSDLMTVLGARKPSRRGEVLCVADVMKRDPVTVDSGETLERAAQVMLKRKISGLPVVDGEQVVGILTESDLFRALCEMLGIGERGARVVFSVRDSEDLLGLIRKRLNGLKMHSLVTVHDARTGYWDVVLRVRGRAVARRQAN